MAKMRVHEISKLLEMQSKDVIKKLTELGAEVKNHMSSVEENFVDKILELYEKKDDVDNLNLEEEEIVYSKTVKITKKINVKDFAEKLEITAAQIIKSLMKMGVMANINQDIDFNTATEIAALYDTALEIEEEVDLLEQEFLQEEESEDLKTERSPVVVVMGHVDHGKTSLLDYIKNSKVTTTEAGGITQHIGAYKVEVSGKYVTFLDTPGHEAFTAMRMRGAKITDIAILVVSADDGVMPQTIEAISHAKAAEIEIIVAINKMDKPEANIDKVKQELVEYGLQAEDWGGSTICVPVSAITGQGIDELLEMIILSSDIKELKANKNKAARGTVIEASLDKSRGTVCTVLVQEGTLKIGDPVLIGSSYGKVRAMIDDKGEKIKEAGPATPVVILGMPSVPTAGDMFYVAKSDKHARQLSENVNAQTRKNMIKIELQKVSLDALFDQIQAGNIKDLKVIVKADVQGSLEALKTSLEKLSNEEVRVAVIHSGVGGITETDVMLASVSNAIIIGFNVKPQISAVSVARDEKVDIRLYSIIYNAIEDINSAMKGLLEPIYEEIITGHAEIRQIFKASKIGTIAGSYVTDGKLTRNSKVRIIRDSIVVYDGIIEGLKRFKDDAKDVNAGYECGILFENFVNIKENDIAESYDMKEIPR